MSEIISERQDTRIREHLDSSFDKELFDRGNISGLSYDPIIERRGSFADEIAARLERFTTAHPDQEALVHNPSFLLGLLSTVSEKREHLAQLGGANQVATEEYLARCA